MKLLWKKTIVTWWRLSVLNEKDISTRRFECTSFESDSLDPNRIAHAELVPVAWAFCVLIF